MDELNVQFNNYVEEFKKLDINSKRGEFIRLLKEGKFQSFCNL